MLNCDYKDMLLCLQRHGVDFDHLWPNKLTIVVDDIRVDSISKNDLITNKKSAGRPKDLLDLDWLLFGR